METELQAKPVSETPKRKFLDGLGGYVVAGMIYALAQNAGFDRTPYDGLIILVVAIFCAVYYYRLKKKIKSNELVRVICAFLILEVIAAVLIGFLTAFI